MSIPILQKCTAGHTARKWRSQPLVKKVQAGDLILSATTVLSGNNYARVNLLSKLANIGFVSRPTFDKYAHAYTYPTINQTWRDQQAASLLQLQGTKLLVSGALPSFQVFIHIRLVTVLIGFRVSL